MQYSKDFTHPYAHRHKNTHKYKASSERKRIWHNKLCSLPFPPWAPLHTDSAINYTNSTQSVIQPPSAQQDTPQIDFNSGTFPWALVQSRRETERGRQTERGREIQRGNEGVQQKLRPSPKHFVIIIFCNLLPPAYRRVVAHIIAVCSSHLLFRNLSAFIDLKLCAEHLFIWLFSWRRALWQLEL